jgi:hypothetical protein
MGYGAVLTCILSEQIYDMSNLIHDRLADEVRLPLMMKIVADVCKTKRLNGAVRDKIAMWELANRT